MHTPLDPLCCASIGRVLSRKRAFTNCLLTVLSMLHRAYNWEHGLCVYYGVFALNTCTPTLYELIGRRGFICKTPPGIYYTYGFARKKPPRIYYTNYLFGFLSSLGFRTRGFDSYKLVINWTCLVYARQDQA
jgi:hypothetical protein